ncbi:MAG: GAF domain-containing protein, partial [Thermoanaerobaculia bacterium]
MASATDARSVGRTLAKIAEIASETLDLQEVFDRVAACIRELIPFEHMGVVRILDGDLAVQHASTVPCPEPGGKCSEPTPLSDWSPRLRPRAGPNARIDDASVELDPSYPMDSEILAAGVRSALWEPFRWGESFAGGVWICSRTPRAFTDDHQEMLRPIAALLGSAVEHGRIYEADRRTRERLDRLDEALEHLAPSLDVKEVVQKAFETIQDVLPHDLLALTELNDRARKFRVVTYAGESDVEPPTEPIVLTQEESERRLLPFETIRDLPADLTPTTDRNRLMIATGMRSYLRVPVRLWGEVRGSLGFAHREPGRFGPEDAEVARRLADRIALVLSHRRLSEEAQAAAEEKERAERLAATVETLTRELEARQQTRIVGVSRAWKEALLQVGRVAPSDTTVLITGESGTGKEVISRMIHEGS